MEVRRTVPVKLDVDSADADLLRETIQQFLDAANYVVDIAQDGEWIETRTSVLHDETYAAVRDRTDLHSNHVQSARNRAVDALKSVVAKWKQGEYASLSTFTTPFCDYTQRNATFDDDHATLSTVGGRVTAEYVFPDENRDTPHSQYLLNDDYETTGATLHEREGEFYLHIRTKADVDVPDRPENGTVLGVDLGVENIAVTSTGGSGLLMNSTTGTESTRSAVGRSLSAGLDGRTRISSRSDGRRLAGSSSCFTGSPTKSLPRPLRRGVRTSPSSD